MKHVHSYDVVVCGAGHAGVEAAYILNHFNIKTAMVTIDTAAVGRMSCNPAIGGLAKGQIVKEIDVLGGVMPQATDHSALQYKILNRSKGSRFGRLVHKWTSEPMNRLSHPPLTSLNTLL